MTGDERWGSPVDADSSPGELIGEHRHVGVDH
jgi:hypothetical protein